MQILEEKEVKCGDCNSHLAIIILTESNEDRINRKEVPVKSKYRIFGCKKCGGSSFYTKTFEGTTNICSHKKNIEFIIDKIESDPDDTIIYHMSIRRNDELH